MSGGHTQIVLVDENLEMNILGQTRDDAAGEAFDKTGKMLGLPYPAGPHIDRAAKHGKVVYQFPEPDIPGLDFSFSGLKTAILYFLRDQMNENENFIKENINNICASIQDRIITILMNKLVKAAKQTGINAVSIAGGVSANSGLRNALEETGKKLGWNTYIPKFEYCTDNAAMIAMAASFKFKKGEFAEQTISPSARLPF